MIQIIVGSMLGASEYVAEAVKDCLSEKGIESKLHLEPSFSEIAQDQPWIIITSTHGAGDLPDNIQDFAEQIATQDLSNVKYLVIGLGDSSYDTFCQGAKTMEKLLDTNQAQKIADALYIDVLDHPVPEDFAISWFEPIVEEKLIA